MKVETRKARTDIYKNGLKIVSEKTKSGFRLDRSQPSDEQDVVIIPKGSTYYFWEFAFGSQHRSLVYPKRSQLTQSDFLSQWYDLQDEVSELTCDDLEELSSRVEDFKSVIESLRDEQEEKRDNMPEQLQDATTGELLQERYEALDELYSELDSIDCEDEYEDDDDYDEDENNDAREQHLQSKIEEIQNAFDNCNL